MPAVVEIRRGSRLGTVTATFVEQVRGQHGARSSGETLVVESCAWVPDGPGSESVSPEHRSSTEARSTLYVPRTLPHWLPTAVCTVVPGPVDADGEPLRLPVAGPAQPFWRRRGRFSHSQVSLRAATS